MVGPAAFPVAKLGFLLIKQVSKPFAKSIAARAKKSPLFKDWVCVPIAQLFHFYEVKMKMRALNLGQGKVTKVPKLTETKAVEQGAEILSEFIIISIASGILIYEYNRSKEKDDAKEEKLKADREMIKSKIFELELKVEKQSTQIRSLAKTAIHLEEEIQKKSIRRLLGKPVDVPQELIKTIEEIPEIPNEVRPLELVDDKKAKENVAEKQNSNENAVPADSGPSIKEIVEQHYTKPKLIENKGDDTIANIQIKDEQSHNCNNPDPGVITESINYVMKQTDEVKSDFIKSSSVGIVNQALGDYFKGAKN